jgi:hypothetical protein
VLVLTAALGVGACGRKPVPAEEYDPDVPAQGAAPAAPGEPTAEAAPPPAPGAPPAPPPTPEQDSIQEARAFARRQQSMESYESCVAKAEGLEEPARTTIRQACGRRRAAPP